MVSTLPDLRWPVVPDGGVAPEHAASSIATRIACMGSTSKAELVRASGMPRSSVSAQVDWLLHHGVLARAQQRPHVGRGRPAETVELRGDAAHVYAVEMGATATTAAIVDLRGRVLARSRIYLPTSGPPSLALERLGAMLHGLRDEVASSSARSSEPRRVAAIAFPARIDSRTHAPLRPTVLPSWDGHDVVGELEAVLGCPVLLENDCAVRAIAEAGLLGPDSLPLLSVQVGTGVGAGIVDGAGEIYRGANGSAGDVGHIPCSAGGETLCACGSRGCVEAVAAVPAMLARLRALGIVDDESELEGSDLLAHLLRQQDPRATQVVRESAEMVGEVVSALCNALNPRRVVITSGLSSVTHDLLAGVRSVVYARTRALATKDLVVDYSSMAPDLGIAGAYLLGRRLLLQPEQLKRFRAPAVR
ncbi:ROK family protein [Agrococcus versicolor]|uniref:ROK family protein n=1 Tax=Agrococcus versicolor TaxID=501482 RepID=A0ABN3ALR5_9MICO